MVVEPFAFYEQHLQLFSLLLVQAFLNNLAFKALDNLAKPSESCLSLSFSDLALLLFRACFSAVKCCHQSYLL